MTPHHRFARRARWGPHSSRISRSERHRIMGPCSYGEGVRSNGPRCNRDLERVGIHLRQGANPFMCKQLATTRTAVPRVHASLVRRTTMLSLRSGPCGAVSLYT